MRNIKNYSIDFLKAISETFFLENAYFGAAFLLLLLIFSPRSFACGLGAALVGYAYSIRYSTPLVLKASGLIPINGLFFGISMASLFELSVSFWACLLLGVMLLPLVTKAAFEVLQHWKLSPFITPYILVVWAVWMCSHGEAFGLLPSSTPMTTVLLPSLSLSHHVEWAVPVRLLWSTMESAARLVFLSDPLFGLSLFVLVTAFSPRRGVFFVSGTLVAAAISFFFSAGSATWEQGLISYGAGLVGLGLSSYPERFRPTTIILFCIVSAFLTMAAEQFLRHLDVPILSLPFVLTMWFAVMSRLPRLSLSWGNPLAAEAHAFQGQELPMVRARFNEPKKAG